MTEQQNTTTHRALLYNTAMLGFEDAMIERRLPSQQPVGAPLCHGWTYDVVTITRIEDRASSPIIETGMARLDRQRGELHEVQMRVTCDRGAEHLEPSFILKNTSDGGALSLSDLMKKTMETAWSMRQIPSAMYFMLVEPDTFEQEDNLD